MKYSNLLFLIVFFVFGCNIKKDESQNTISIIEDNEIETIVIHNNEIENNEYRETDFSDFFSDKYSDYDSYYYIEEWEGTDGYGEIVITGENRVFLKINRIDDEIKLIIMRDMTGFGQSIITETIAEKKGEKYEFQFLDGWENRAFGSLTFNIDDTITFYLDCDEFSEFGRNIGRLYGDTYILKREIIE